MRWWRRLLGAWIVWRLFGHSPRPKFAAPQEHPWRLPGRTIYVGDEEFVVREAGPEDGKPLLMIHGLAGSSLGEWYQIGQKLATERRVIMVDHRSHGLAPKASARFEISDDADDVAGVLDAIGVASVDVVGYSMGGNIAQELAHRHPGRVSKLVLIATFAAHPKPTRWFRWLGAILARAWERMTGTGTPEVRTAYLLATGAVERRHGRWLWEETHRREIDAGAEATFALLRFDSRRLARRLEVETIVVIPTADLLVPPAWQYELASLIPDARVTEIIGARHEVVWSHPEEIIEALRSFLD